MALNLSVMAATGRLAGALAAWSRRPERFTPRRERLLVGLAAPES